MIVRHTNESDLKALVNVHNSAFKDFFMTSLGSNFLVEYYKNYLNPSHISLVLKDDNGAILGFVVGTNNSAVFYKSLKSNWRSFLIPLLSNLFNVKVIAKVSKRILSIFTSNKVNELIDAPKGFNELTSIGVFQNTTTKGIGTRLLQEYEMICRNKDIPGIYLTTDALGNEGVLKFYQKHGYSISQEFIQDNKRSMYLLIKKLN